jgi:hypothetical protein
MAFVILTINSAVWGGDAFATAEIAEAELRHFFKRDLKRDKFSIVPMEAAHGNLTVHDAITGDYAGMGADELARKYPAPKPAVEATA